MDLRKSDVILTGYAVGREVRANHNVPEKYLVKVIELNKLELSPTFVPSIGVPK